MGAWNGWYHVTGSTYGTWLRGDERGWREWHHHEHVEGDYRDPPPEACRGPLRQSRRAMKHPPVRLSREQRQVAGEALVAMLAHLGAETVALCVGAEHYHLLCRFLDADVRGRVGRAKKNASHVLRAHGLPGTVWAKRCGVHPIQDRQHQVNVYQYILDHAQDGAWTWDYRKPVPPLRKDSHSPDYAPGYDAPDGLHLPEADG